MSNYQDYDGYRYAVMDDTPKSQTCTYVPTSPDCQCQDSFIEMPAGWSLVPYSADIVSNVVTDPSTSDYQWGTVCLVFSNGNAYGTYSGGYCTLNALATSGSSYKVTSCNRKVLIRRPL